MEGEKGNEWSAVWAEGIASMMFTFMACGVITASGNVTFEELNAPRLAAIALAQGFAYSTMVYLTNILSSTGGVGYLNPAVTIAIASTNAATQRYSWKDSPVMRAVYLVLMQFAGAIFGVVLVMASVPNSLKGAEKLGSPQLGYGSSMLSGFTMEFFGAFFLTWVILANTCRDRSRVESNVSAPIAVGLAVVALTIFAYPFTGAAFNPARALAPMLCAWSFNVSSLVVYVLAPILGSVLSAAVYITAFTNSAVTFGFSAPAKE
jgi:glycerol uptake facilitator-like aquaporin